MNTADLLDRYNAWRKGEIETWRPDSNEGPSPKDITAAITEGAAALRELATLRAELDRLRGRLSEAVSTKCDAWWARGAETGLHRAFRADETIPADAVPWWNVGGINGPAPQDDARDAERYRYIRDKAKDGAVKMQLPLYRAHYFVSLEPTSECPTFDEAIDAAILAAKVKP